MERALTQQGVQQHQSYLELFGNLRDPHHIRALQMKRLSVQDKVTGIMVLPDSVQSHQLVQSTKATWFHGFSIRKKDEKQSNFALGGRILLEAEKYTGNNAECWHSTKDDR